jgi:hypothetical protein
MRVLHSNLDKTNEGGMDTESRDLNNQRVGLRLRSLFHLP